MEAVCIKALWRLDALRLYGGWMPSWSLDRALIAQSLNMEAV
jgi:hypothetical protein